MVRRWDHLMELGNEVMKKWSDNTLVNRTLDDSKDIISTISHDPMIRKMMTDTRTLARDFIYDRTGRPNLFVTKEVVEEMKDVVIPVLMEHLRALPLPIIQGSTPKMDFAVRGILVQAHDIMPQHVRVSMKSDVMLMPRKEQIVGSVPPDVSHVKLEIFNVNTHMRDLHFYFRKKTFPKFSDEGFVDVDVQNLRLTLKWGVTNIPQKPISLQLESVKCVIGDLRLKIKEARLKVLYGIGIGLFHNTIRDKIEQNIETQLMEKLGQQTARVDNLLAKIHQKQENMYVREAAVISGAQPHASKIKEDKKKMKEKEKQKKAKKEKKKEPREDTFSTPKSGGKKELAPTAFVAPATDTSTTSTAPSTLSTTTGPSATTTPTTDADVHVGGLPTTSAPKETITTPGNREVVSSV